MHALNFRRLCNVRTAVAGTLLLLSGATAACGGDKGVTGGNSTTPAGVSAFAGDGQSATVGTVLAQALQVKVTTVAGAAIKGATVNFAITSGSASLSATSVLTDSAGIARTQVTLGSVAGAVIVDATVPSTSLSTRFTITATAAPLACTSPSTMEIGAATVVTGSSVCLTSTSTSEYAIVPFNTNADTAKRTFAVLPSGTATVSADPVAAEAAAAVSSNDFALSGARAQIDGRQAFELGLRERERSELTPKISAARSWYASRSTKSDARFNMIPANVAVGSLVSLNSNPNQACTRPDMRAARVMAVGRKAIVVADTLNPADGFTQTEYESIAATFDDVVDAVDTKAFGDPSDIDGNGHVILYFTAAVNALTPKDADYYIGGFFFGRDLFPTTGNTSFDGCAASNVAEMFYMLVADPNGSINNNKFSKDFVTRVTISTVAHEYQHLINASRRMYVNLAATDFEETWLDEGLAHMAEELLLYKRSGLSPKTNIDATLLRSSSTYVNLFNSDAIANFSRLGSFITNPSRNSPYSQDDSLGTRGAAWSFLRYAIDQQSATQEALLYQIVNSDFTGLTNLRAVFGTDLTPLFRDWATSFILDEVSGAAQRYQARSWNLSSIFRAINSTQSYPLSIQTLTSGASRSVSLSSGSSAYFKFGIAAGSTAALALTVPTGVTATVVRLK